MKSSIKSFSGTFIAILFAISLNFAPTTAQAATKVCSVALARIHYFMDQQNYWEAQGIMNQYDNQLLAIKDFNNAAWAGQMAMDAITQYQNTCGIFN